MSHDLSTALRAPERDPVRVAGVPLRFPSGLFGFPGDLSFSLHETNRPGIFFLEGNQPGVPSFALIDPFVFFDGYHVGVSDVDLQRIDAMHAAQVGVFAITVPDRTNGVWTANLRGPLVINVTRSLGAQIVLQDGPWGVREEFRAEAALSGEPRTTPLDPPSVDAGGPLEFGHAEPSGDGT